MPPLSMLQQPQPQMNPMDQMGGGGGIPPQILMMLLQAIMGGSQGGAPQGDMPVMATNMPPNDPTGGNMDMQKLAALRAQGLI